MNEIVSSKEIARDTYSNIYPEQVIISVTLFDVFLARLLLETVFGVWLEHLFKLAKKRNYTLV